MLIRQPFFQRTITVLIFLGACIFFNPSLAQTQFWSDTFEDTGAPSSGTRTASIEFGNGGPPFTRYFRRTDGSDISLNSSLPYTNIQGTKFWAGEDLDGNVVGQAPLQTITWTNINIAGKTGLSFRGLIAGWNGNPVSDGNSIWEGLGHPSGADFIEVLYSIDGAPFTKIVGIYCHTTGNISGILKLDTNNDQVGEGTTLNRNFQEFTASIPGTGNTLSLRLNVSNGSLVEEFAFDNFRLFQAGALPVKLLSFEGKKITATENGLTWITAEETNASHFAIERSLNGIDFVNAGTVNARGAYSTYLFSDKIFPTTAPKIYYRIRMVDMDGTADYSRILFIANGTGEYDPVIYPSVTHGPVWLTNMNATIKTIAVYTSGGQLVQAPVTGSMIDLTGLQQGYYLIVTETLKGINTFRVLKK